MSFCFAFIFGIFETLVYLLCLVDASIIKFISLFSRRSKQWRALHSSQIVNHNIQRNFNLRNTQNFVYFDQISTKVVRISEKAQSTLVEIWSKYVKSRVFLKN